MRVWCAVCGAQREVGQVGIYRCGCGAMMHTPGFSEPGFSAARPAPDGRRDRLAALLSSIDRESAARPGCTYPLVIHLADASLFRATLLCADGAGAQVRWVEATGTWCRG